jgi:hypothetical protein
MDNRVAALVRGQGVAFKRRDIPVGAPNRPGILLWGGSPNFLIIHGTANRNAGAGAAMHNRFLVEQQGGRDNVSFHYVVDDKEVYQNLPMSEVAWQAGDGRNGEGNRDGVAIEICVNPDQDWLTTMYNVGVLTRAIMAATGLGKDRVTQHNRWSGKNCPDMLRANGGAGWQVFLKTLIPLPGVEPAPAPEPPPTPSVARFYRETGHSVGGAFLKYLDANGGIPALGYPVTEEMAETIGDWAGTVQYFERVRLEWHTESGEGVVMVGRAGAELAEARGY